MKIFWVISAAAAAAAAAATMPTLTSGGPGRGTKLTGTGRSGVAVGCSGGGGGSSCARPLPKTGLGGVNLPDTYADPAPNLTRCCSACDASPRCVGWTLNAREQTCFLKSSTTGAKANPAAVASGLKASSPLAPPPPPYPPPPPAPPGARNVLFVPVDDMRPSQGAYGQPVITPNFDRFAAAGVLFSRAFANFAWCVRFPNATAAFPTAAALTTLPPRATHTAVPRLPR